MSMQEATYLILMALAEGRRHGYGVILEVSRISDGSVVLKPGTLYGALDRLTAEGAIAEDGEELVDGRRRRYYTLTDHGLAALADETQRRGQQIREAKRRLRVLGVLS